MSVSADAQAVVSAINSAATTISNAINSLSASSVSTSTIIEIGSHNLVTQLLTLITSGNRIVNVTQNSPILSSSNSTFDTNQSWTITYDNGSSSALTLAQALSRISTNSTALNALTAGLSDNVKSLAIITEYWNQLGMAEAVRVTAKSKFPITQEEEELGVNSPGIVPAHLSALSKIQ